MINRAKRGTLSSALLTAPKAAPVGNEDMPVVVPIDRARAAEPLAAAANARGELERENPVHAAIENILFSKGAASAAAFRPPYWSYDQTDTPLQTENDDFEVPAADVQTTPPVAAAHESAKLSLWLALAASSCLALVFPAVIFALSLSRHADDIPTAPPAALVSQDRPSAPVRDAASLIARGDTFLGTGDIASARLYYEQAADAGDARAAMFLGLTYDPAFLSHANAHGLHGDIAQAAAWYRRARELGEPEAVRLLTALDAN